MTGPLNPEVAILNAALELAPAQRVQYLDSICGGDSPLRKQVETLLSAHEAAGDFLETVPIALHYSGKLGVLHSEKPGDCIGNYKLLQRIGEGGCGIVYMAEQERPVRRRVALKIIRLGMDTESVIARFEAERQALALMDHPNIARVLDAGATETGRPYFVMELVPGIKITDYCERHGLSTRDRLDLFVQVCGAIQHAHQKGIIHRDIKPSNILVTVNDGAAVPKVIDFGIAKATQGRLTDKTLFTAFEQFIGTPAYMSPEQATMTSLDIDTRSDIYGLGVLLYELLTRRTPFDGKELLAAGLVEMRRTITEVEPAKPSTRLREQLTQTRNADLGGRSEQRLQQTIHVVRGDLDWVVMKCLEKDRARRYETANGLAHDIQRYLKHEPVSARPASGLYRFRKAVRRNKTAFAAAGAVLVVLIAGVIASTSQAIRAKRAEREESGLREQTQTANRGLRNTVSVLELERAEDFFQAGDSGSGVAHLAAMLRRDPSNHIAAMRLVSALVHRDWALRAPLAMRHNGRVETICFSPDGARLLTASADRTAKIWSTSNASTVATLQHGAQVWCAQYSPDGSRIVTASADGTARIWSATNGTAFGPPLRHQGTVNWAEFSPDGTKVVSAGADKMVRLWDGWTGALLRELGPQRTEISIARFSPDAKQIVTGSKRGSIRFFHVESGSEIPKLGVHYNSITALCYSPDGRRLVSASEDGVVWLWSVARKEPINGALVSDDPIDHAVFSPDGKLVLTSSHDTAARIWDASSGKPIGGPLVHGGRVVAGKFSPDGKKIATISKEHSARVWDARTAVPLCQPIREPEEFADIAFSPDGRSLATASLEGNIRLWDLQARKHEGIHQPLGDEVNSISFSPDGSFLAAAPRSTAPRVLDMRSTEPDKHATYILQHEAQIDWTEFSPDGTKVLTGASNGTVRLWDWRAQRVIAGPFQHSRIRVARFSPHGERIVTAAFDGVVRVWHTESGQPITPELTHGGDAVAMVRFSPDGAVIASAGEDHSARLWNARTGKMVCKPLMHADHVKFVDFNPDGSCIVTASTDNTARIWDAHTGAALAPPLQHARIVDRAFFSADGLRVITASMDRTARIWDANTGEALTPPLKHQYSVYNLAFSPDGARALTGCWNGVARVWDSKTGQPLTEPLGVADWNWRYVCFDSAAQQIATGGRDATLRFWHVPPAPIPVPEWFPTFAEAVAGIRLGTRGQVEPVQPAELDAVIERINATKSAGFYEQTARWFLADPAKRTAMPF